MRKILVVSDNADLTLFFQGLVKEQGLSSSVLVDYAYSSINKSPAGLIDIGATPLDLKLPETIDFVVNHYVLIFSLHCKQIFPEQIVNKVRCINLHPGLNPYNRGWYPQVFSIINKKPIGATLHFMDDQVDHGEIIAQKEVFINSWDTSLEVYNRVICAEKELLLKNIVHILNGTAVSKKPQCEGNYNSILDFKKLCELDLHSKASLKEHIDLLRALSHGNFMNAYYVDEQGGQVFIKIELTRNK